MTVIARFFFILASLIVLSSNPLLASDHNKETRWAEQIKDGLFDAEMRWMDDPSDRFLTIYTAAEIEQKAAVIILHGTGAHPDWPQVIQPLRAQLPALGWSTWSVQLPVLANDAHALEYVPLFDEVGPRLDEVIRNIRVQSSGLPIYIIGHSLGAAMATYYLAHHSATAISGLIGIGMNGDSSLNTFNNSISLQAIHLPVLDLYGEFDLPGVLNSATKRANAAKLADNNEYQQQTIKGADHFFETREPQLINHINSWLNTQTSN